LIRVISLENEDSLIQLICEEHGKSIALEVKGLCKIDFKQTDNRLDGQPVIDSWKDVSRRHALHVKPTLIDQDAVMEVTRRDANKTWFFTHV
jgi:ribulose 1,5-bisphosphate synthetase/thiazole synthase